MPTQNSWNSNIPVEISKGGTNATSMANTDGVVYFDGTSLNTTTVGTAGQVLTSNGAAVAPTFQSGVLFATTTLTSLQIKSLHATPIQLIAAPGPNKIVCVISICGHFIYGGTSVFVASAAQRVAAKYNGYLAGDSIVATGPIDNSTLTANASKFTISEPTGFYYLNTGLIDNSAVMLYNPVATEISGNAENNNTANIYAAYYIASV